MRNPPPVRNRGNEMKEAKELFVKNGFSRLRRTNNYYKINHDFYTVIYFQRKSDGTAYFVNIGLHPLFLDSGLLEEVDCALRTRLGSIDHRDGMDQAELEKAVQDAIDFTAQYSSYPTVFSSIDPEKDLDKDWLLEQFSITKVNLCRLYVEYYDSIDSKKLALDFANYGLSITPKIASVPKNFFKTYIRSGEIIKTTY